MESEFPKYRPIPRFCREIRITEKIDGTNGLIFIEDNPLHGRTLACGSRNRWLRPGKDDNYGFASWVDYNVQDLMRLGPGYHYGEWYGSGIQRGYGLHEKRFMLFQTPEVKPDCCEVATVLYEGEPRGLWAPTIETALYRLEHGGSNHVPGFMNPEGIVIQWAKATGRPQFKITLDGDGHKNG